MIKIRSIIIVLLIFGSTSFTFLLNDFKESKKIIENIQRTSFKLKEYNVLDFGARGDGVFDNSKAINEAITTCSREGGGKVIIPGGKYLSKGPINLKSNVNLYIDEGALLLFSPDPNDYLPVVFTRWEGVEIYNYSPLIYTASQENVAITGAGTIDGQAKEKWVSFRQKQGKAQNQLREMGKQQVPVAERVFGEGYFLRTPLIQFINCDRVLVEGVTLTNSPFWILHPVYTSNMVIRDVKFHSLVINNDGIDVDSSNDILIENCNFQTGDDAVVFKSGRDQDGWRVNRPSKNVVVRNCFAPRVLHGIAFGSEMSGGVENIYIENFIMDKVMSEGVQFKANKDRGGYIRNINIRNITVDSAKNHLIYFTNDYHGYRGGNAPSEFYQISFENVHCNYAKNAFQFQGLPGTPIHDINVKNVILKDVEQVFNKKEYIEDMKFKNVLIEDEEVYLK